jgi:hypothetical protein
MMAKRSVIDAEAERIEAVEAAEAAEAAEADKHIALLEEYIRSLKLKWTLKGIDFLVNREGCGLNQLRAALFDVKGTMQYDYSKAAKLLIAAGMVDECTAGRQGYEAVLSEAEAACEYVRLELGLYAGVLQVYIVDLMEEQGFFMGRRDVSVLGRLRSQGRQALLIQKQMAAALETVTAQTAGFMV